jgi:hypothetical protein
MDGAMISRAKLFLPILAGLAGSLAAPTSAAAQCRLCANASTEQPVEQSKVPLTLSVETRLEFGQIVMFGDGEGTATIRADGTKSATGSIDGISGRALAGTVTVQGEPNRAIRVALPKRIILHSLDGAEIRFDDIASDLPSVPRLGSTGSLTFRFGGRLTVSGDAEGEYRGEVDIDAHYLEN